MQTSIEFPNDNNVDRNSDIGAEKMMQEAHFFHMQQLKDERAEIDRQRAISQERDREIIER